MRIQLKIDKLTLSTPKRVSNVYYSYNDLPGYKLSKHINTSEPDANPLIEVKDSNISKYEKVIQYKSTETKSSLIICHKKKKDYRNISPLYLIFYTDYHHKITYPVVSEITSFFKQLSIPLRISIIHLALDLISNKTGLYEKVITALKPGSKRKPNPNKKLQHKTSKYFGEITSSNQLIIYDKAIQLKKKHIQVNEDICRIELRMRMNQMNNFIRTIDELANFDWSFVYPKYYSFHFRTKHLKQETKAMGQSWRQPIWNLRDIMEDDIWPSNFYRDYLINHPQLSVSVPRALKHYRWGND